MCNYCSLHNDDFFDAAGALNPTDEIVKVMFKKKFDILVQIIEAARQEHPSVHIPGFHPGCQLCIAFARLEAWEKEHDES